MQSSSFTSWCYLLFGSCLRQSSSHYEPNYHRYQPHRTLQSRNRDIIQKCPNELVVLSLTVGPNYEALSLGSIIGMCICQRSWSTRDCSTQSSRWIQHGGKNILLCADACRTAKTRRILVFARSCALHIVSHCAQRGWPHVRAVRSQSR